MVKEMVKLKEFWSNDLQDKESISLRSIQRRLKSMNEDYSKGIRKKKDWKFNIDLLKDIHFVKELLYPLRNYDDIYKWNNYLRVVDVWERNNDWTGFGMVMPFNVEDENLFLNNLKDLFNRYKVDFIITKEISVNNGLLHYHFVFKKNKEHNMTITKNMISTNIKSLYGKDGNSDVELFPYEKDYMERYRDKGNSVSYILKTLPLFNGINSIGCYDTPQYQSLSIGSNGEDIIFK